MAHFMDKAISLSAASYLPTVEDVLRVRKETSAVEEEEYWIEHALFQVVDVGGQRTERRKWVGHFDGVSAVVFVVSLAEYDQTLEEDSSVNRLIESLEVFSEVANSRWFDRSALVLMLNKKDVFAQKIATVDLRSEGDKGAPARFLDYTGGCNQAKALEYILGRFTEIVAAASPDRQLHHHVTCATDTKALKAVIKAVKEEIVREMMMRAGMED